MSIIIPGNDVVAVDVASYTLINTDGSLIGIDGEYVVSAIGDTISIGEGINPNNAVIDATLTPSDKIIVTFDSVHLAITPVTNTPSDAAEVTYAVAEAPIPAAWG